MLVGIVLSGMFESTVACIDQVKRMMSHWKNNMVSGKFCMELKELLISVE